jgi:hypothetical protein
MRWNCLVKETRTIQKKICFYLCIYIHVLFIFQVCWSDLFIQTNLCDCSILAIKAFYFSLLFNLKMAIHPKQIRILLNCLSYWIDMNKHKASWKEFVLKFVFFPFFCFYLTFINFAYMYFRKVQSRF